MSTALFEWVAPRKATKSYVPHTLGVGDEVEYIPKDKVLEKWGIKGSDGKDILLGWKRSGYRKAGDYGVIDAPEPATRYGKSLYESMFKGW